MTTLGTPGVVLESEEIMGPGFFIFFKKGLIVSGGGGGRGSRKKTREDYLLSYGDRQVAIEVDANLRDKQDLTDIVSMVLASGVLDQ